MQLTRGKTQRKAVNVSSQAAKKLALICMPLLCSLVITAQTIEDIQANRAGSQIQISCILQTASPVNLTLSYSDDGGLTFKPCVTVNGDLFRQSEGLKILMWNCARDGVVVKDFVFKVNASKPPGIRPHLLIMPGAAFANERYISYSLITGVWFNKSKGFFSGPFGVFAKYKNILRISNYADDWDRMGIMGGIIYKGFYGGIGYGSKTLRGQWREVERYYRQEYLFYSPSGSEYESWEYHDYSPYGVEYELGGIFKIKKFIFSAGVSYLPGDVSAKRDLEPNISIGLIF